MTTKITYDLYDSETGDRIRQATPDEVRQSLEAGESDGGQGHIVVEGRKVYAA
jgi:hypothetical protein